MRAFHLAEAEGFEPPVPFGTPVFKTGAIDQLCQTSGRQKYSTPCKNTRIHVFSQKYLDFSESLQLNDNIHYGKQ